MARQYRIIRSIDQASGWQSFVVDADSREEALQLHKEGKSKFEDEEVEVTALHTASIGDVEEAD